MVPQVPQLFTSSMVLTQAPLQSMSPVWQTHAPAVHTAPVPQAIPQPPQLAASVMMSTHVPLQSMPPPEQPQVPALQALPAPQAVPQVPQLALSVMTLAQAPLQLTCGAVHDRPPVVLVPAVVVLVGPPVVLVLVLLALLAPLLPGVGSLELPEQPHTMAKISVTRATRVVLCFIRVSSARSVF